MDLSGLLCLGLRSDQRDRYSSWKTICVKGYSSWKTLRIWSSICYGSSRFDYVSSLRIGHWFILAKWWRAAILAVSARTIRIEFKRIQIWTVHSSAKIREPSASALQGVLGCIPIPTFLCENCSVYIYAVHAKYFLDFCYVLFVNLFYLMKINLLFSNELSCCPAFLWYELLCVFGSFHTIFYGSR